MIFLCIPRQIPLVAKGVKSFRISHNLVTDSEHRLCEFYISIILSCKEDLNQQKSGGIKWTSFNFFVYIEGKNLLVGFLQRKQVNEKSMTPIKSIGNQTSGLC